jgi:hypothetical protein
MTNSGLLLNHPEMAAWFESAGNQAAFFQLCDAQPLAGV